MRDEKTPLASAIDSFLLSAHDLSEKTRNWYEHYLSDFSRWTAERQGREAQIRDLDLVIANAYIGEKRLVSLHSARAAAVTLKRLGSFLVEYDVLEMSPLTKLRVPKPPKDTRRPYKDAELAELIDKAGERAIHAMRDRAIVALMLGSGIRLNECRELRLDDIDWRRKLFVVRSETSKGQRRTRVIRLDAVAAMHLDRYVRDCRPQREGPVFLTGSGKPFRYGGFQMVMRRIKDRCGVEDFKAHRCRITWATNFRRVGAGDLFDLQEEGGWAGFEMPRHYSKARPVEERSRTTPLAGLFNSRGSIGRSRTQTKAPREDWR